ncbi:hypothetical protein Q8A73_008771 [Channa argus]|nr:hypothetical protein Q8A73_008771 [Channa argus]
MPQPGSDPCLQNGRFLSASCLSQDGARSLNARSLPSALHGHVSSHCAICDICGWLHYQGTLRPLTGKAHTVRESGSEGEAKHNDLISMLSTPCYRPWCAAAPWDPVVYALLTALSMQHCVLPTQCSASYRLYYALSKRRGIRGISAEAAGYGLSYSDNDEAGVLLSRGRGTRIKAKLRKLLLIASLRGQVEPRSRGTQPPSVSLQPALSQIEPEISPAAQSTPWSNNPQPDTVKPPWRVLLQKPTSLTPCFPSHFCHRLLIVSTRAEIKLSNGSFVSPSGPPHLLSSSDPH